MIFVDTGAWYALFDPNDQDHQAANDWYDRNIEPLVTTDYILDEVLTLLRVRGEFQRAVRIGEAIIAEDICILEWVLREDIVRGWEIFSTYRDKRWSFTDCVSRSVIERLKIMEAFSFDDHFRQFGIVDVVP